MKSLWDKVYYAIRWPLGWLLLRTRNGLLAASFWGFTWVKWTIRASIWIDDLGVDILPEKAPPDRLEKIK